MSDELFALSAEDQQLEKEIQASERPEVKEPEKKAEEKKEEPKAKEKQPEEKKGEVKTGEKPEEKKEVEAGKEKHVPLAALNEARYENRRLKQEIEKFRQDFLEFKKTKEPPKEQQPDEREDPLGYQAWKLKELERQQLRFQQQYKTNTDESRKQQFVNQVDRLQNTFRMKQPDYDTAFEFVKDFETKALAHWGITDQERINYELGQRALGISIKAIQNGKNPAEAIYNLAKSYGYKQPEAKTANIDKIPGMAEHLDAVKKGQEQASKTLSGGGDVDVNASFEQLLKADGKEFDELWEKLMSK